MLKAVANDDGTELYLRDEEGHGIYLDKDGSQSVGQDKEDGELLAIGLNNDDPAEWLDKADKSLKKHGLRIKDIIDWAHGVLAVERIG
jgi:hypothetical protein